MKLQTLQHWRGFAVNPFAGWKETQPAICCYLCQCAGKQQSCGVTVPRSSGLPRDPAAASRSRQPSWPLSSQCGAGGSERSAGWHYCSGCCRCCSPAAPRCSALHTQTHTSHSCTDSESLGIYPAWWDWGWNDRLSSHFMFAFCAVSCLLHVTNWRYRALKHGTHLGLLCFKCPRCFIMRPQQQTVQWDFLGPKYALADLIYTIVDKCLLTNLISIVNQT